MANKKLKNFEYANHSIKGKSLSATSDKLAFFESINGFVFIICDGNIVDDSDIQPSELSAERIKYYLENEFVNDPSDAVYNALVYANGFIFEHARKNPDFKHPRVSCSIILIRNNECFYSVVGNTSVDFFNGKKIFTLAREESVVKVKDPATNDKSVENVYIGERKNIVPVVNREALIPLNDDIILISSDGFYGAVSEKLAHKILNDPMPVQTKAYRLIDTAIHAGTEDSASVQIIAFYNLDHTQRKFSPIKTRGNRLLREKLSKEKDGHSKSESQSKQIESSTLASVKRTLEQPATKYTVIILAALLVIYMFYDLFLYDPVPSLKITKPVAEETSNLSDDENTDDKLNATLEVPDDRIYRVQSGDTWSRIYSRFEVCSWFIKNHPPNIGKFDSDENPVAGSQIRIPLIYSGRRDLNPDFYQEFNLEKTGSRCENAGEEFLNEFRENYSDVF
ncbi:MAG: PP2C family serine/threonine-protein phosphatase [Bacteroidales bacterium]